MLIPDYFQFYKEQKLLNMDNAEEIMRYYRLKYSSAYKPYYHCMPLYNTVTGSTAFRYCVFHVNNDDVFICYKIILFGGSHHIKQIRVMDTPISINGCIDNENLIISELHKLSFVKIAFKTGLMGYGVVDNRELELYNDYYYHFDYTRYNSSKFRSKHGINKLMSNPDFSVVAFTGKSLYDLSELRQTWVSGMKLNKSDVPSSSDKDFMKFIEYDNKDLLKIVILYKDVPISVQVVYLCEEMQFADCLYIVHKGRTETTDPDLTRTLNNLADIQNYFACKYLAEHSIEYMYIAGCRPEEKRLLKHKELISDGCLRYSIDDNLNSYDMDNIKLFKEEKVDLWK